MSILPLEKLERLMVEFEQQPGFLKDMLIISLNCTLYYEVRLVAATALESGIETYWGQLPDDDKSFVKAMVISNLRLEPDEGLFDAFANTTLNIAQCDGLGNFEDLASSLLKWLKDNGNEPTYEDILLRPRALKVLKLLAKSDLMSSQWEAFKTLSAQTFDALVDCLVDSIKTYSEKVKSNDELVQVDNDELQNAIDCLKVLKRFVLCNDDVQAKKFFKSSFASGNILLESRSNVANQSDRQKLLELNDKCLIKHLKIFMRYNAVDHTTFDGYLLLLSRALLLDQTLFDQTVLQLQKYHNFAKVIDLFLKSEPDSRVLAKGLCSLLIVENSAILENMDKIFNFILATLDSQTGSSDAGLEISMGQLSLDQDTIDYREFVKAKLQKWRKQINEDDFQKLLHSVDGSLIANLRNSFHLDL